MIFQLSGIHGQASHPTSHLAPSAQLAMRQESGHPFTPLSKKQPVEDSPDPLALRSGGSTRTASSTYLDSSEKETRRGYADPVKRLNSMKTLSSSSLGEKSTGTKTPQTTQSGVPITPSSSAASLSGSSRSSVSSTPTAKRINLA